VPPELPEPLMRSWLWSSLPTFLMMDGGLSMPPNACISVRNRSLSLMCADQLSLYECGGPPGERDVCQV